MWLFVLVLMIGPLNVQSANINCTSRSNQGSTEYVNVSCTTGETLVSCGFLSQGSPVGGTRIVSDANGQKKCQARRSVDGTEITAYAYCCDFASAGYSVECAVITAFGTIGKDKIQSATCSSPTSFPTASPSGSPTTSPTASSPTSPTALSPTTASPTNSPQPTPNSVLVDCSPHLTATNIVDFGTTGSWMSNAATEEPPDLLSNNPTAYSQCNARNGISQTQEVAAEAYCCQDTSKPLSCLTGYFLLSADGGSTLSKNCSDVTDSTDYMMMSCNVWSAAVDVTASYVDTTQNPAACKVERPTDATNDIYAVVTCCTLATASPTTSPSLAPTGNPTAATSAPTPSPSDSPSQSPSKSPTRTPSVSPSSSPSKSPTNQPSTSPSKNPTAFPSLSPSENPSTSPTISPTRNPSVSPTPYPTQSPTKSPTLQPSTSPTKSPSKSPTSNPSASPSQSPSKSPSQSPSKSPTSEPTPAPTTDPTSAPSLAPTSAPSRAPSFNPTPRPTPRPTRRPTKRPVVAYTPAPHTKRPTRSPTSAPTVFVPGELDLYTMFVLPMIATLALSVFLFAVACLQKWLRKREKEKFRLMYDTRARAEEQRKERERLTQPAEESVTTQQMNKWVRKMDAKAARERKKEMERERDVEAGIELQSAPTQPRWTAAADDEEEEKVPLR